MSVTRHDSTGRTSPDLPSYRQILPLCLAGFSGLLNVSVLGPFVALVAADLGVSVSLIGLTATVSLVTTASAGLLIGWLADARGFRKVLVSGLGLLTVSGIGAALSPVYVSFLLFRALGAVGFAAANSLPNAVVSNHYRGSARRRALGSISAASVLAGLVGPPVLTFIGDVFSWRAAFSLVGVIALLAAVGTRLTLSEPDKSTAATPGLDNGLRACLNLLRDSAVRLLFLATVLQMASLIGALTYAGAFLTTELGLSVRYVGLAFAAQSLGGLTGSLVAGRLPEHRATTIYTVAASTLGAAVLGIYVLAPSIVITTGMMLLSGFAQVTAWVTLVGLLARATPAGQGTTMALNGSMLAIGGAVGTAVGSLVLAVSGYPALGLVLAASAAASGVLVWRVGQWTLAPAD